MERQATKESRSQRTVVKVGETRFGRDPFPVIAGPCAVESENQINTVAEWVADNGASVLRAAAYRQGHSPYFFQGLKLEGARLLAEAGRRVDLPVAIPIMEERHLEEAGDLVDLVGDPPRIDAELRTVEGGGPIPETGDAAPRLLRHAGRVPLGGRVPDGRGQ